MNTDHPQPVLIPPSTWKPPGQTRETVMRLLLAIAGLAALAAAGPKTPPAQHPYTVPSCHGIAAVPGYEKCRNP